MRLRVFMDVEVDGEPSQSFPVPYAAVRRIESAIRAAMTGLISREWEVVDLAEGMKIEAQTDGVAQRAWAFVVPDEGVGQWSVRVPVQRGDGSKRSEVMIAVDGDRRRGVVEVNMEGVATWVHLSPAESARLLRGVMKMQPALRALDDMALQNLRRRTGD